jgi:hypothetical protein
MNGDVRVFPAQTGQLTQMNGALDLNTNRPMAVPVAPQAPVMAPQPAPVVQPVQAQPAVDVVTVRNELTRLYTSDPVNGPAAYSSVMNTCGLTNANQLNDGNVSQVWATIQSYRGR